MMEAYASIYEKKGDCVDKKDKGMHNCAKKVCHEEYGEGETIFGQHAVPDENGFVSHYNVQFEHGIVENVSVEDLTILEGYKVHENHEHEGEQISEGEIRQQQQLSDYKIRAQQAAEKAAREKERKERGMKAGPNTQTNSADLFDIVKGHLMSEGFADTEEAALVIMANMSEEWRQSIIEERGPHYGLVGVPKKAIDKIPGVRALRTAASNTLHRMDYQYNAKPVQVGDKVVPYYMINPGGYGGNALSKGYRPAGRVTNLESGKSKSGRQIDREL